MLKIPAVINSYKKRPLEICLEMHVGATSPAVHMTQSFPGLSCLVGIESYYTSLVVVYMTNVQVLS